MCNDDFVSQVRSKDIEVVFLSHNYGEHAFDMRNNDETSQNIIKQTIEFITTHMKQAT
jgi:hypothetical protein